MLFERACHHTRLEGAHLVGVSLTACNLREQPQQPKVMR